MKGILLAGGHGTRLYPLTFSLSKQILPVFDKPMIYYPLSMLMLAGIREVLVISTPGALPLFQMLLKDGSQWGMSFSYVEQPEPKGIARYIFYSGPEFIGDDAVCLLLGDNIFYGHGLPEADSAAETGTRRDLRPTRSATRNATASSGDESGKALGIQEEANQSRSHYAVPASISTTIKVVEIAANMQPSAGAKQEDHRRKSGLFGEGRSCG